MPQKDVVIIGGGIGGLVAAAYLARAGRSVTLLEQHRLAGGCCTTFRRKKYHFDAAVHAVGGCAPGGALRTILEDLDVWPRLTMLRADPMDCIVSPHWEVPIHVDTERFLAELCRVFPAEEKGLRELVENIVSFGPQSFARWGKATYREFLDHHLKDPQAKVVFMLPLGNIGLPSHRIGAINACTLFRENQLNGGFFPQGGFQTLADLLAHRIREMGGEVRLRTAATAIEVQGGKAVAVRTSQEDRLPCRAVISNASPHHTFLDLVGPEHLPQATLDALAQGEISFSGGMLYLGLSSYPLKSVHHRCLHWYVPQALPEEVDACFEADKIARNLYNPQGPVYLAFPSLLDPTLAPAGGLVVVAIAPALYISQEHWRAHKEDLGRAILGRVEQMLPDVASHVEVMEVATPATVERYTRNTQGAWYGWASLPEQSNLRRMDRVTPLENLYLAGHWTRPGPGVVQVAKSGQITARLVGGALRREGR